MPKPGDTAINYFMSLAALAAKHGLSFHDVKARFKSAILHITAEGLAPYSDRASMAGSSFNIAN